MNKTPLLLFILLVAAASALHLQEETTELLDELKRQQKSFQTSINGIMDNINKIDQQVSGQKDLDQKILILENAIISERDQIFELSTEIIPPFNISKASCEKMTDQQKVILLDKLYEAREQVNKLKDLTDKLPECDEKNFLLQDIKKQITFMDSIESIIYTDCSMNVILSPTIFQTNIYAKNWILGNLTIDNLIDQYYLRSKNYENVTNCPIQFPFFDGRNCIMCNDPQPVFNISEKKCVSCGEGVVDNNKKACIPPVYYTNWSSVSNYDSANQPLPETPTGDSAVKCPEDKPYTDGEKCIPCELPQYFYVPEMACKECEEGQEFDDNEKKCDEIKLNYLTRLSGTRWVSDDKSVYDALKERQQILNANETSGRYHLCPTSEPYYDGITCITCDYEFSIDTQECVSAPLGSGFDPNLHKHVPLEKKQTNPDAPNLIGHSNSDHPDIQNCNQTHPYYDGVACINCEKPFQLFDTALKQCVACSPEDYYNSTQEKCVPRPKIYISQNNDKLLATPSVSIEEYQDQVTKKMQNPDAFILNCQDEAEYSNFQTCFTCADDEYFNVQFKICSQCEDGHVNETTSICIKNIHYLTNLNNSNIVNIDDRQEEEEKQQKVMSAYENVKVCPEETPYFNSTACISCEYPTPFFDYENRKCIGCPDGLAYSQGQCKQIKQVTNVSALSELKIIESEEANLESLKAEIKQLDTDNIVYVECIASHPYFNETRQKCTKCHDDYALDMETNTCIPCGHYDEEKEECYKIPTFSNVTVLESLNYTGSTPNETLTNMKSEIQNYTDTTGHPYKACPADKPLYNEEYDRCMGCKTGQAIDLETGECFSCHFFDTKTHKCYQPTTFSNVTAIKEIRHIETEPNDTLAAIQKEIDEYTEVTGFQHQECPGDKPYFNETVNNCTGCTGDLVLDLETGMCVECEFYDEKADKCYKIPTFTNVSALQNVDYIEQAPEFTSEALSAQVQTYSNETNRPYKQCPEDTPYYNKSTKNCSACDDGQALDLASGSCVACEYYDENQKQCFHIPKFTNITALSNAEYIEHSPQYTSAAINKTIQNYSQTTNRPYEECSEDAPYYNESTQSCLGCGDGEALDLESGSCVPCEYYDQKLKQCFQLPKFTNVSALSNVEYIEHSPQYTGAEINKTIQNYSQTTNRPYEECPEEQPFYIEATEECMSCEEGLYFDLKTEECIECSNYNSTMKACLPPVPHYPNLTNSKWVVDESSIGDIVNWTKELKAVNGSVECPAGKQFYNNDTESCQSCPEGTFFNYDTSECIQCDPQEFDVNVKKCLDQVQPNTYQTSLQSPNLINGGLPRNQYQDYYDNNKTAYPDIQDCPAQEPYYDGINCIQCPDITPYFNLRYQRCQVCPEGSEYQSERAQCISNSGSAVQNDPNPQKMYANLFHQAVVQVKPSEV